MIIIGGGAAGLSCALILGSAQDKDFARDKNVGIIMHQKTSHLQTALLNNVLGLPAGTPGAKILKDGPKHLAENYPGVVQIQGEKVKEIESQDEGFSVKTNKNSYSAKKVVIAVGYTNTITIKGLEEYIIPHKKTKPDKNRIQLKNEDHLVKSGLYVAGTLSGCRSQFAIACGSGASVATDILSEWNGEHTKIHDKLV
ncbi:NAD(P)-binding domain-containing protein [Salegentibacter sediminis]|uniref:NAD(P)-binding domain-containing protein n=1 Tax=Salegentibacter sediminis TaxID=1930251 RepID=UPI0009BEF802|nr:NAD(P)-binding domain-containing protein [Salegentibacter sediminis]